MIHQPVHRSFGFAIEGIVHAVKSSRNFRLQAYIGIGAIIAGILLNITRFEMLIVFMMSLLVLSGEMINSSLEEMVDLITTEHRQEAKIAKDVAAGMVLLISLGAVIIGIYIFFPYVAPLIGF